MRDKLKWAMSEPERLRPDETRQAVTERAAATFAELAQGLRDRDHDPQAVAHFVNRLVFCMFAEDVGLLPGNMFARLLQEARRNPMTSCSWPAVCSVLWQRGDALVSNPWPGSTADCSTTTPRCRSTGRGSRQRSRLRHSTGRRSTPRSSARCSSGVSTRTSALSFPDGLSPDIRASDYADDPRGIAIADAARRLVELRDRWLSPPEWVDWVDEPVPGYPKRRSPATRRQRRN